MAALHGGANVEREILGRHQPHGKLAGVQSNVNLGIDAVQVVDHRHVLIEIVERDVPILGHDKIEADEARVGRCELESQQNLREYDFVRQATQNLIEIAHGY